MEIQAPPQKRHRVKKLQAPLELCQPDEPRSPRSQKSGGTLPQVWRPRCVDNADGRFHSIKRLKARLAKLKKDCGCNSTQKRLLCERAVFLSSMLETIEVKALTEGLLDGGLYAQTCNALLGLLRALGLNNQAITDVQARSLGEYVKAREEGDTE